MAQVSEIVLRPVISPLNVIAVTKHHSLDKTPGHWRALFKLTLRRHLFSSSES
jgi:hypothetical protein